MSAPSSDAPATEAAQRSLERIAADGRDGIFVEVLGSERVLAAAAVVDERVASGEPLPLAGSTVAVKANIDVAGIRTTAGCPSFGDVAAEHAPVVAALERAGAVVVAVTNMDQFATGLVGTRSPYGICPNAHWPGRISGGSSSGSGVAVASGLVDLALGTDTAGSGRVPAAANGIVGIKPTRGRISTVGVVPACRSLDCVSVFARTVEQAARATAVAADGPFAPVDPWRRRPPVRAPHRSGPIRIGVPTSSSLWFDGDEGAATRHAEALPRALAAIASTVGVDVVEIDLAPFLDAAALLYGGAFVAERFAAVGEFVAKGTGDLDPVVHSVIAAAEHVAGWEVFRDLDELQRLRAETAPTWERIDALVVPTVPRIPTVDEVAADPVGVNAMLGTYTNFVNLLDLAAVAVPAGPPTDIAPPPSLTVIGPAWTDDHLVDLAYLVEHVDPAA